jgi:hypothetical protein
MRAHSELWEIEHAYGTAAGYARSATDTDQQSRISSHSAQQILAVITAVIVHGGIAPVVATGALSYAAGIDLNQPIFTD